MCVCVYKDIISDVHAYVCVCVYAHECFRITPFVLGSMSVGLNILIRHSFMDL